MVRGNNSVGVNKPTGWGFLRLLPLQVVGDSGPWPQPPGLQALKSNLDCSTVTGRQLKPRPAQSRRAPREHSGPGAAGATVTAVCSCKSDQPGPSRHRSGHPRQPPTQWAADATVPRQQASTAGDIMALPAVTDSVPRPSLLCFKI